VTKKFLNPGEHPETIAPVTVAQANATQDAEFLDARGVEARFSIRRSLLYELHNGGHIRSVSLRRRGKMRGKRLFVVDSVREFLRSQMEGGK